MQIEKEVHRSRSIYVSVAVVALAQVGTAWAQSDEFPVQVGERTGRTWVDQDLLPMAGGSLWERKITAADVVDDDQFGWSVAIDGDTAIVGAFLHDEFGEDSGSVYVFQRDICGLNDWCHIVRIAPVDGAAGDQFGIAVAISGDTAIVGANGRDDNGADSGCVYVYNRNEGGLDNWGFVTKINASDGAVGDQFGVSVDISDDMAVVGSLAGDGNDLDSGAAYVYQRDEGGVDNWGQVTKIIASDGSAGDQFGVSVGISGRTAIVGASFYDLDVGAAYIYERNEGGEDNWGQTNILLASDRRGGDLFGNSVAIDGDTAIVGAHRHDHGSDGVRLGSAYVFHADQGGEGNWGEVAEITADDGAVDDYFGISVAVSGDVAVVGASRDDFPGPINNAGSAYVYRRDFGGIDNWGQVFKVTAGPEKATNDWFGSSVAISGDEAIVGANLQDDNGPNSGLAYMFRRYELEDEGEFWRELDNVGAIDALTGDRFGWSVAISGDTAIVGANENDENGVDSGAVYIFHRDEDGEFVSGPKITASDGASGDRFGYSVAISGDTAFVGSVDDQDNGNDSGSVYVYQRDQGGADNWGELTKITASDGMIGDSFGGSLAVDGDTAAVGASGVNTDKIANVGAVYVLRRDEGGIDNWGEVIKIMPSDGALFDHFGGSVDISGDTLILGARSDDENGEDSGSVYIYQRNEGGIDNWGLVTKITPNNGAVEDWFGHSVAISGDLALVGAPNVDDVAEQSGMAFLYGRNQGGPNNWGRISTISASDQGPFDRFGWSVDIRGDRAIVGMLLGNGNEQDSGALYVYRRNEGGVDNWGEVGKIAATDGASLDNFGRSVALNDSNDTVIVGAMRDSDNGEEAGSAYLYATFFFGPIPTVSQWGLGAMTIGLLIAATLAFHPRREVSAER